jgi:DTW domain-containing protein
MCRRCRRPTSVCYCIALPRIETATRVVILQHPRERDMPIGTAHMARLCLPQAELHVGVRWGESPPLLRALADPARPPILLYPGPGARDILRDPPRGPVTLVVVDGTWSQAKTVVRDNPVLHALPRYAFATPEPSQYRIRREPRAEYVSTIEALMHVLGVLEGEPARFRQLLDPLRMMVDAQLACQARAPRRRVRQPRPPRPPRRFPDVLTRRFDDLVCVVGEANAWPYRTPGRNPPDELVHWVAHRVATGETFSQIAAPEQPLSPSTPFHSELPEDELRRAGPRDELLAGYARFSRPTDVVCAWGTFGLGLLIASGGALPVERIDLRTVAHRIANRKLGSLEAYAATLASPPTLTPLAAGRAGRRLALLVEIVRAWHALALASDAAG